ncbi:MAG: DUF3248 domain-containing protein [Bacteroidetes bacterium]|nr:DUF3248 domain-containing protein [Bacteroidota bacterium]
MKQKILLSSLFLFPVCTLFGQVSIGLAGSADFNNYRIYYGKSLGKDYTTSNTVGWSAGIQTRFELNYLLHLQAGFFQGEANYRPYIQTSRGLLQTTLVRQYSLPLGLGLNLAGEKGLHPFVQAGFVNIWRASQVEYFENGVVRGGGARSWPSFAMMPYVRLGLSRNLGDKFILQAEGTLRMDGSNKTGFNPFASQYGFGLALRYKLSANKKPRLLQEEPGSSEAQP